MCYIQVTKVPFILNYSNQHQQIALTLLSGIGSKRARIIVSFFNDLDEFFRDQKLDISRLPGIPNTAIGYQQRKLALEQADKILNELARLNGDLIFLTDSNYPKRLKQCEDAPLVLYSKGNIDWNARRIVAVVGTRNMTHYGQRLTQELISGMQHSDVTVVSGMAYGVDICAHKMALSLGMSTWGVLGHGLDRMYPASHLKTADKMFEMGGLITEFAPGMDIEPGNFPMRNRVVAGLSDATIVIESGETGGSLITANLANDYHREVFAFPGDVDKVNSAGCLKLIKEDSARLACSAQDILEVMEWKSEQKAEQPRLFVDLSSEEEQVMEVLLEKKELHIDAIGFLSKMPVHIVSSLLLHLEFKGLIRSLPGKRFSLS